MKGRRGCSETGSFQSLITRGNVVDGKDWVIVFATLAGPILAVQAQKWVEGFREKRQRKMWVFSTLMATRGSRLSMEHVQALNMINLAFYGSRVFGVRRQTESEKLVCDAWQQYLDNLGVDTAHADAQSRDTLFVTLLMKIADDVGLSFDRIQIGKNVYSPMGHIEDGNQQTALRKGMIEVLAGRVPIKMDVTSFPMDAEAVAAQTQLHTKIADAFGEGGLKVEVSPPASSSCQ
jgi:hypothetical protein